MQQVLLYGSAIFCFFHSYRDWSHSKKRFDKWFLRVGHFWDAPKYEVHGMVVSFLAGCGLLYFAIR